MSRLALSALLLVAACKHARDPLADMGGIDDGYASRPRDRSPAESEAAPEAAPRRAEAAKPAKATDPLPAFPADSAAAVRKRRQELEALSASYKAEGRRLSFMEIAHKAKAPAWSGKTAWELSDESGRFVLGVGVARLVEGGNLSIAVESARGKGLQKIVEYENPPSVTERTTADGTLIRSHTTEGTVQDAVTLDAYITGGDRPTLQILMMSEGGGRAGAEP